MIDYRAFTVGEDGHIDGGRNYKRATDQDAIVWARQWLENKPIEIWNGERFVKRLEPEVFA